MTRSATAACTARHGGLGAYSGRRAAPAQLIGVMNIAWPGARSRVGENDAMLWNGVLQWKPWAPSGVDAAPRHAGIGGGLELLPMWAAEPVDFTPTSGSPAGRIGSVVRRDEQAR